MSNTSIHTPRAKRPRLAKAKRSVHGVLEVFHHNIQIVTERLTRKVEPQRFCPLVGEAELIPCHWECIVFSTETVYYRYLFQGQIKRPCVEVVYIDKDYLVPIK